MIITFFRNQNCNVVRYHGQIINAGNKNVQGKDKVSPEETYQFMESFVTVLSNRQLITLFYMADNLNH